jgi:hypothetical protein
MFADSQDSSSSIRTGNNIGLNVPRVLPLGDDEVAILDPSLIKGEGTNRHMNAR